MKEQIVDFIEQKKKEKREKHLLKLKLYDESKAEKKYMPDGALPYETSDYNMEDENGKYKLVWKNHKPEVLDVTDEEYDEICKVCPPSGNISNDTAVKVFKHLNWVTFVSIFFLLILSSCDIFSYMSNKESVTSGVILLLTLLVNFFSLHFLPEKDEENKSIFEGLIIFSTVLLLIGVLLMCNGIWGK
jgi:hypothetical protein